MRTLAPNVPRPQPPHLEYPRCLAGTGQKSDAHTYLQRALQDPNLRPYLLAVPPGRDGEVVEGAVNAGRGAPP